MNRNKILTNIVKGDARIVRLKDYIVAKDFQYILNGITIEYVKRGAYVWRLRFPLFDPLGVNLHFSCRVSDNSGFIDSGSLSESEISSTIMGCKEYEEAASANQQTEMSDFVNQLERTRLSAADAHTRFIRAVALLFLSRNAESLNDLDVVQSELDGTDLIFCKRLLTASRRSAAAALELAKAEARGNLEKLGALSQE